ncbi:hypothetical protein [Methanobrevibacter sp.]|uniref:hypothetical protein n=1 Tax=Methanobrevibacter sp. TaxID=66852 RepID=UPI00388EE5CF
MDNKNYILGAIIVLVVLLIAVGAYIIINDSGSAPELNITANNTTANVTNTTTALNNTTNVTPAQNNTTYKVYNPQSDSYVTVIGEKYDDEVNRWYTYDKDGVRYYNTRI